VWQKRAWFVLLALYKVGEDRILAWLNDLVDGFVGDTQAVNAVVAAIPTLTWLAIPLTIAIILFMAYRDTRVGMQLGSPTDAVGTVDGRPHAEGPDADEAQNAKWREQTAESQLAELRANYEGARAREQAQATRLEKHRHALKALVTWLYRRDGWHGLSAQGRTTEAAPWDAYAKARYSQFGLEDEAYEVTNNVHSEPGWKPPAPGMKTFRAEDGNVVTDGDVTTLTVRHGAAERVVTGTVRAFEQEGEIRWEISTGDPQHPAIGFLPEAVVRRTHATDDHASTRVAAQSAQGSGTARNASAQVTDTDLVKAACSAGGLLWEIYSDHPIGSGQEQADRVLRDRLREWENLVHRALGNGPDRDMFDSPVNTSGMDNRIQVATEQLRVKREILRNIARERGVSC
jgi:hypothetical protein